jgi:hypothetical protein
MVRRLRLAAEIAATYVRARRLRARADLPSALEQLRAHDGAVTLRGNEARAAAIPLTRAARRALDLIPADSRCLMRSLVVTRLLARRGIASTLVVAARVEGGFEAHAWVEVDGRAVLEPGYPPFQRLVEL